MEVFCFPGLEPDKERLVLTGPVVRHIARATRHRALDRVLITDGKGSELEVELVRVLKSRIDARVLARKVGPREPRHRLGIAQAILKGDKLAKVVEGVTELGAAEFIPVWTRRVVGRLSPLRLERLRKVAMAGVESSARSVVPRIAEPVDITGLLSRMRDYERTLVAYEGEQGNGIDGLLAPNGDSVLVVVGPEGGFEDFEVARLRAAGAHCFSLGPRRLRAETAAVVAAALCLHELGDLG
ncbi:MAG: RsmE family RNA methyltransferase [candidate division WOR-3 bacterium]